MITPEISIIIVNYNVRDFLINAVKSLKKSLQNIENEIFIVDNASLDDSVEITHSIFPDINIIRNNENVGFAKANNIALKQCKGKFILLMNPDTIVQEDTISRMLEFFYNNPHAGIAGCKVLNADGTLQLACRRSFPTPWTAFSKLLGLSKLFPSIKLFGKYNLTYLNPDDTYEVEAISGSFMMFRREVYEDIGGLDEDYFMYGEDLDWFYRAYKRNWKIYFVHSTQIIHYKGESTKRSDIDSITKFYEAMHLFVKKHYKSPSLLVPILRMGIFFRAFIAFIARAWRNNFAIAVDFIFIVGLIFLAELIRFNKFFNFPGYAYPTVFIVPSMVFISTLFAFGVYNKYKLSISRSILAVIMAFLILSSLTYFVKTYAFSRAVLIIMSSVSLMILPGWRIFYRLIERSSIPFLFDRHKRILGRRTVIVGYDEKDKNFIHKLKNDFLKDYNIIGILLKDQYKENQIIKDTPILGSINGLSGITRKYNIEEVIFSTNDLTFTEILSLITNCRYKRVVFKLIPHESNILESRNFKTIDSIDLVEIDLKINKIFNKFIKRVFDFIISTILILFLFPIKAVFFKKDNRFNKTYSRLINVFSGKYSFVGISELENVKNENLKLGKYGLTGLAQINTDGNTTDEEKIKYNILYARNQSFLLDIEILFRTMMAYFKKRNH